MINRFDTEALWIREDTRKTGLSGISICPMLNIEIQRRHVSARRAQPFFHIIALAFILQFAIWYAFELFLQKRALFCIGAGTLFGCY